MNGEGALASSFALLQRGDAAGAERALASLWNASSTRPAKAYLLMGLIRNAQARSDEAELLYRKSIEIEPCDAQAHYNLGLLLHNASRIAEAKESFERALVCNSGLVAARFGLARCLEAGGNFVAARKEMLACLGKSRAPNLMRACRS